MVAAHYISEWSIKLVYILGAKLGHHFSEGGRLWAIKHCLHL